MTVSPTGQEPAEPTINTEWPRPTAEGVTTSEGLVAPAAAPTVSDIAATTIAAEHARRLTTVEEYVAQKFSGHHGAAAVRKAPSARAIPPRATSSARPAPASAAKLNPPR